MYIYIAAISIFITLLTILIIFAFPEISPIPYFPSNKKDISLIIKALSLKNNQTIVDLGAGDGIIVFEAAEAARKKKLNTKFIAIDLNPILVIIMKLRRLFHKNRSNIHVIHGDMFKLKSNSLTRKSVNSLTFYTYISPWYMEKVYRVLKKSYLRFTLISYFYSLPKNVKKPKKHVKGIHDIYTYNQ